jgi:pimeloyl-ACP methyl ester carboxylesterase
MAEVYGWMMEKEAAGVAGGLLAMRERKDYTTHLAGFRLPALVIGAEEDRAVSVENARTLAEGLPQSRLCIIPGAGHLANLEQPKEFNNCLLDFLREI